MGPLKLLPAYTCPRLPRLQVNSLDGVGYWALYTPIKVAKTQGNAGSTPMVRTLHVYARVSHQLSSTAHLWPLPVHSDARG